MLLRICDGEGCSNALESEPGGYHRPMLNTVGWLKIQMTEARASDPTLVEDPMLATPDPELLRGEVIVDGKPLPFILHKPAEISERERAYEEKSKRMRARKVAVTREVVLCPTCGPKMPPLKAEPPEEPAWAI